jgi:hypothetical protein
VEPKFKVPDRSSKLDPFAEKLSGWLRIEAGKSRKQKRTAKQMHADLVALGYDGSYGRVSAFVRTWKADRQREQGTSSRGTFVPLVFAPGEAFQFDWSEDWALLGGERTKLQVAHQAVAQQGVHRARLSAPDPRDAVRRADPGLPGARRRSASAGERRRAAVRGSPRSASRTRPHLRGASRRCATEP